MIIILLYKWEHSAYSISISSNNILLQLNLHPSFLESTYHCENEEFLVRQVPGDGGCLFHSLAVCLSHIFNSNFHFCDFDSKTRQLSDKLRQLSVDVLSSNNVTLHMESENYVMSNVLLELVAYHYNSTTQEYLEKMRLAHTWGGGPEIVCLSNALKRPIFVYELDCIGGLFRKKCFQLKVNTKFGIPDYEKKEPLHILCADGRYYLNRSDLCTFKLYRIVFYL